MSTGFTSLVFLGQTSDYLMFLPSPKTEQNNKNHHHHHQKPTTENQTHFFFMAFTPNNKIDSGMSASPASLWEPRHWKIGTLVF